MMGQYTGSRRPSVTQHSERNMNSRTTMPFIPHVAARVQRAAANPGDVSRGWERGGMSSRDMARDA